VREWHGHAHGNLLGRPEIEAVEQWLSCIAAYADTQDSPAPSRTPLLNLRVLLLYMQDSTCIAFDLMSVNLADLPVLPSLLPALRLLFEKESEEPEEQEPAAGGVEAGCPS